MASINSVTSLEQFRQIINQDKVAIFDFWASWCGPCRTISPVFEQLSKGFASVDFYKIDVDANEEISQEAGIRAMPTFIAFKNGAELERVVGAAPQQLEVLIRKYA